MQAAVSTAAQYVTLMLEEEEAFIASGNWRGMLGHVSPPVVVCTVGREGRVGDGSSEVIVGAGVRSAGR